MGGVLLAKWAVLLELQPVGGVLLVLFAIVVALFAFGASQCYFVTHCLPPLPNLYFRERLIQKNYIL
jgi:hypothetical protein